MENIEHNLERMVCVEVVLDYCQSYPLELPEYSPIKLYKSD